MNYVSLLNELGVDWPTLEQPDLPFSPTVRIGDVVYVSGQIPEVGADIVAVGKVGKDVSVDDAKKAAAVCASNILYWLHKELDGDLDRVVQVAKITVYVNAAPEFKGYSQVGNGASELFLKVLGSRGQHARAAIGMGGLPENVPVEVDAVVHVR